MRSRVACALITVTHSTNNTNHPRPIRPLIAVLVSATFLWLALIAFPTAARADGDPASDVLATQPLFLPHDAGIPTAQQVQLGELLQAAARNGYQIRVAVIASRSDLGSVTELWRQPQAYARFLDHELSLVYHGPLLVAMPGGFGYYDPGSPHQPPPAALAGVRIKPEVPASQPPPSLRFSVSPLPPATRSRSHQPQQQDPRLAPQTPPQSSHSPSAPP